MFKLLSLLCLLSVSSFAYARLNPRIIGGSFATERQFPYQISLQTEKNRHLCGGGIIGERFILTAAHCVIDGQGRLRNFQFKVVAGMTDLKNSVDDLSVHVEKIYVLKSFRPIDLANDIAVLKLKQDLDFSRGLSKLELPINRQNYVGQIAKIAGYGLNWLQDWKHGASDHILRYLNVNIITNDKCRRQFSIFASNIRQRIHDSNVCGQAIPQYSGDLAGVCKGDSGSPLVIGNTVIGIASPRIEKALAARYTQVSNFVEFVNNVLAGVQTDDMRIHNITGTDEIDYIITFPDKKQCAMLDFI